MPPRFETGMLSIVNVDQVVAAPAVPQVLAACLRRYSAVASIKVSPWWNEWAAPTVATSLEQFIGSPIVMDPRLVAQLVSRAAEALDLLDETPTGALYYPYQALMLVEMAGQLFLTDETPRLARLVEYVGRFAGHVDWQLGTSGILTPSAESFAARETRLWQHASDLTGRADAAFVSYVEESDELAAAYRHAVTAALAPRG